MPSGHGDPVAARQSALPHLPCGGFLMDKKTKKSPVKKPELPILDDASLKNVVGGTTWVKGGVTMTDDWETPA
jgi:hypothetical protein